ncbi:transposase [Streptomyces sp. NPDC049597]|uniref:transposase n=1 Tax=Streptomyces sp. NPDC049597 TaxID=3155276 RepID=UPI00342FE8FC
MEDAPTVKPTALIIDDTGFSRTATREPVCHGSTRNGRQGDQLPGGRVVALARGSASSAIDRRLFLPGRWDPTSPQADPARWPAASSAASRLTWAMPRSGSAGPAPARARRGAEVEHASRASSEMAVNHLAVTAWG